MTKEVEDLKLRKSELNPLLFCIAIVIIQMFGIDMYMPSMPYIASSLHTTQTVAQLTIAFYVLGTAFSALFSGPLSDKIGRKPVITMGIMGMLVGSVICFFAFDGASLLIGRIIQGAGAGFSMSANRAAITDTFSAKKLAIMGAYFSALIALSPMAAPVIGGYLEHYYDWRANFFVLGITYLIILLLFTLFFKETIHEKQAEKLSVLFILKRYQQLLTKFDFTVYALCGSLALGVTVAYATNAAFVFQKTLGISPIVFGWFGIFVGLGNIAGKIVNASLIKRYDMQSMLIAGIFIVLLSGVILLSLINFNLLSISAVIMVVMATLFGQSFIMTSAFSLGITPYRHIGGAANALLSSGQMFISFLISGALSLSATHLSEANALALSYIVIGLACAFIFMPFFLKNQARF